MKISETIKVLKRLAEKFGEDTEVYFDCPSCNQSFKPTTTVVAVQAIHIGGKVNEQR